MNANECAVAQRLIVQLDGSRAIYTRLLPLLDQFHLKYLVARIIAAHRGIAEELSRMMDQAGGVTARRGAGGVADVRASIERCMALASVNIEMGCINRIVRRETRLSERLAAGLDDIEGLHPNLYCEQRMLERALSQLEASSQVLQQTQPTPPLASVRSPARARVQSYPNEERSRR